jgi:hypothetical protein
MSTPAEPTHRATTARNANHGQARAQFTAITHGIPIDDTAEVSGLSSLVLAEALLMTGVQTTAYENQQRDAIARIVDPETAQLIAGWIIRAYEIGQTERR